MKIMKNLNIQEWYIKRKLRKQMMDALVNGYKVNVKKMTKEKVNGMSWKERLLTIYIIDLSVGDFSCFHRTVKPISNNLDFKILLWDEVLGKDGKLL